MVSGKCIRRVLCSIFSILFCFLNIALRFYDPSQNRAPQFTHTTASFPDIARIGKNPSHPSRSSHSTLKSYSDYSIPALLTAVKDQEDSSSDISVKAKIHNCQAWEECSVNPQIQFSINGIDIKSATVQLIIQIGEYKKICKNGICILDMPITDEDGLEVRYWAESSSADILQLRTFKMRNVITGGNGTIHSFDIMGDDFSIPIDTCATIWGIFPKKEEVQSFWLQKAETSEDIYTEMDFDLLAGRLIWYGYVDASDCPGNGLLDNGAANECGLKKAHALTVEWQNHLNQDIVESSNDAHIPTRILKGMIAQESQFWPYWEIEGEYGYGMLTEFGADLLLTWNEVYFMDFCSMYYAQSSCDYGYFSFTDDEQSILKGICLATINTDEEVLLLANVLEASCTQTRQLILNITDKEPQDIFSYHDLWKLSLGVYNSGSGCIGDAIDSAWVEYGRALTWKELESYLPPGCENAFDYFDKVTYYGTVDLR